MHFNHVWVHLIKNINQVRSVRCGDYDSQRIVGDVQTFVHVKQRLLEEGESLALPVLALVEDVRHVLDVLAVLVGDVLERIVIALLGLCHLLSGLLHPICQLLQLRRRRRVGSVRANTSAWQASETITILTGEI